jgi:CRISPR-associated endonuclease/helicase Cas3
MVVDISKFKSHPHKELTVHTQGVMDNVEELTPSKLTALAALFHDLGKLNPNFQTKLKGNPSKGYGNHAYLSSFGLLCFSMKNHQWLKKELGEEDFQHYFLALLVVIARHHGNLPNFDLPFGGEDSRECKELFKFIGKHTDLPVTEFIQHYEPSINSFFLSNLSKIQDGFSDV